MVGGRDLLEPQPVCHGRDELANQFTGMVTDDGGTQDAVATRRGQHLDEAIGGTIRQGPVQATSGDVKVAQGTTG